MQVQVKYSRSGGNSSAILNNVTKESFQDSISNAVVSGIYSFSNEDDQFLVIPANSVNVISLGLGGEST